MRLKIPPTLKAILLGSVIGGVSSVLLSLTLEPEISEVVEAEAINPIKAPY